MRVLNCKTKKTYKNPNLVRTFRRTRPQE